LVALVAQAAPAELVALAVREAQVGLVVLVHLGVLEVHGAMVVEQLPEAVVEEAEVVMLITLRPIQTAQVGAAVVVVVMAEAVVEGIILA
jgi:hypothetical protein